MSMAAKKPSPRRQVAPEPDKLTPFNMRMPEALLVALDAWVDELNEGRSLGKVNRSDLIRAVLEYGCRERPDLDSK